MPLLHETEIQEAMEGLADWLLNGHSIEKRYEFADFAEAMGFVNRVAEAAEKANHHPDIEITWNKVKLTLSTHSEGGLTRKDMTLAAELDRLV